MNSSTRSLRPLLPRCSQPGPRWPPPRPPSTGRWLGSVPLWPGPACTLSPGARPLVLGLLSRGASPAPAPSVPPTAPAKSSLHPGGPSPARVRAGWSAGEARRACSQRAPSYAPRRPCCPLPFCVFLSHPGGVGASREGTLVPASSAPGAGLVTRLFERGPDGRVPSSPTPAPDAHVQAPGPGPTQHEAVVPSRIGLLFVSLDCLCFKEELF